MIDGTRGVSDVLAFTLLFGIIITSVGLISVVGFEAVGSMSDSEQLASAEESMTELADQLTGIADHEAPVRSTELRASGATVSVVSGPRLNVTIENETHAMWAGEFDMGGVEYRLDDRTITVVGGAVFRNDGEQAVMLRDPPFLTVDNRTRLNLLRIEPADDAITSATSTRLQLRSYHDRSRLVAPNDRDALDEVETIEIEVVSDDDIADAWRDYLDDASAWTASDSDSWRLEDVDDAVVRLTRTEIQFLS